MVLCDASELSTLKKLGIGVMLRFLGTVLAVFTALLLFFLIVPIALISVLAGLEAPDQLPDNMVLTLDMRQPIADAPSPADMPSGFGGPQLSVVGIVDALEKASGDADVKGLYLRGGQGAELNPAQVEEIREAIVDFKSSGRFVITHVQDLSGLSLGPYYIASVGDEVWMQPNGQMMAQGLGVARMFFKNTLDLLDSSAQVQHYFEYKTAMHSFIHEDFTEPQREAEGRMIKSIYDELVTDIAYSRDMSAGELTAKLSQAPYIGDEAVDAGWVDKLGFDIEAETAALDRAGADAELVSLGEYSVVAGSAYEDGEVIAFVHGEGPVVEGEAPESFFGGSDLLAGDTISRAIRDATDDEEVQAIVFRVNSPGGSPIASDQIWHAVEEAQAAGKPVIINMSGVAASGGYWVAMGADKIVAQPTTITGSIGVVGGKFILKGLYDRFGVSVGELSEGGDMVFMFSDQRPFSEKEWLALTKLFDGIYNDFTAKVADGRGIPETRVREIARGRVWTGADAHDRQLVDELGGFKTSLALAKEAAGIAPDAEVEVRRFPEQKSFYEQIAIAFGASAQVAQTFAHAAAVLELEPVAGVIEEIKRTEAMREGRIEAISDVREVR